MPTFDVFMDLTPIKNVTSVDAEAKLSNSFKSFQNKSRLSLFQESLSSSEGENSNFRLLFAFYREDKYNFHRFSVQDTNATSEVGENEHRRVRYSRFIILSSGKQLFPSSSLVLFPFTVIYSVIWFLITNIILLFCHHLFKKMSKAGITLLIGS